MESKRENRQIIGAKAQSGAKKSEYVAPKILSRENLEAVASTCPAPTGKQRGTPTCSVLSS